MEVPGCILPPPHPASTAYLSGLGLGIRFPGGKQFSLGDFSPFPLGPPPPLRPVPPSQAGLGLSGLALTTVFITQSCHDISLSCLPA